MSASISELEARRDRLRAELGAVGDLRPGTLVERYRKCGKPSCHCAREGDPRVNDMRPWEAGLPLCARGRPGPRSGLDAGVQRSRQVEDPRDSARGGGGDASADRGVPAPAATDGRADRGQRRVVPRAAVGGSRRGPGGEKGGFAARVAAELAAEAQKLIGVGAAHGIDFQAIETEARRVALQLMGQAVAERLNADHCDEQGPRLPCACGAEARFAGRRTKTFTTALGTLPLERAWYHCERCHSGFSPRDRALGLENTSLSPAALRMIAITAASTSFAGASALLRELAGLTVASKTVERHAEALGREVAGDESRIIDPEPSDASTLYLGLDGTGVPVRTGEVEGRCGKQPDGSARTREAKLAVVWSADTTDNEGRPVRDPGSATYNAAIETIATRDTDPEPAPFARRITREAERRGFATAPRHVILGDGAPWIWNFADEHFPDAVQIVDLFHAKGHVFEVAKAIYGTGSEFGERWARQRRDELDAGRVDDVIAALRGHAETCEEARKDAEYFSTNRERMDYPRFRAMGLCVATGVVEGGCKHIVGTRLKRGGMRWSVAGANAIIALRCAVESNRFDDFWERRAGAQS